MAEFKKSLLKPIIKWAGGKAKLVDNFVNFLPSDFKKRKYWEPFFGGGSLFFKMLPQKAVISDLNEQLINMYVQVRDNPKTVSKYLLYFAKQNSESFYYELRNEYNSSKFSPKQAARFIFLNKACFNGIFRVNQKGEFNVPYSYIENPSLPTIKQLIATSEALKKVVIKHCSFESIVTKVAKNDFVYLDPPYPPLNGSSFFTHYTKERFSDLDQIKVAKFAEFLSKKGCLVMISNADKSNIRKLYSDWKIRKISTTRWITCKKKRYKIGELIITNY